MSGKIGLIFLHGNRKPFCLWNLGVATDHFTDKIGQRMPTRELDTLS